MNKRIQVFTNDPPNNRILLSISGKVLHFAKIAPRYARLVGKSGTDIQKTITITREKAYPFKIIQAKARSGKDIAFTIEAFSKEGADGYILTIENKRERAGRYADTLTLMTDSPVKSSLRVPVYGQIIGAEPQPAPPPGAKNATGG
jgi:hypothetical protein